ncbi:MAG: Hint domain-containing protein, partial [Candidatus Aenigmatarchaeota archaeon]
MSIPFSKIYLIILIFCLCVFSIPLIISNSVSAKNGIYIPNIKFDVPLRTEPNDMGIFVRNSSMNVNFNLTFDYPFPLGENETVITAEIYKLGEEQPIQTKTIDLKPYLKKYKVISSDENYILKPIYFNISVDVIGYNVSYQPVTFTYTVTQKVREPFLGEADESWKVWGRYISDLSNGKFITNNYCSGPWDFEEITKAYMCNNSMIGDGGGGGGGGETNIWCCANDKCGFLPEVSCDLPIKSCSNDHDCTELPQSFSGDTNIILSDFSKKTINMIKPYDEILSFKNGKIVNKKVIFITGPHKSDHYYILQTINREVKVTGNHEFYTPKGYVKAKDLWPGDEVYVLSNSGKNLEVEKIVFKGLVLGEIEVYDFEVEDTHTYFANGFAVHNDKGGEIVIQRGAYTAEGKTVKYQKNGPILYFEIGDNEKQIPNEPGTSLTIGSWYPAHSWKFETFILSKITIPNPTLNVYVDDGAWIRIREYPMGDWFEKDCLNKYTNLNQTGIPCTITLPLIKNNNWYQLQVYLYNDPGGRNENENP